MNKVWDLFVIYTEREAEEIDEKTYDNNEYDTYDGYDDDENDDIEIEEYLVKRAKKKWYLCHKLNK